MPPFPLMFKVQDCRLQIFPTELGCRPDYHRCQQTLRRSAVPVHPIRGRPRRSTRNSSSNPRATYDMRASAAENPVCRSKPVYTHRFRLWNPNLPESFPASPQRRSFHYRACRTHLAPRSMVCRPTCPGRPRVRTGSALEASLCWTTTAALSHPLRRLCPPETSTGVGGMLAMLQQTQSVP